MKKRLLLLILCACCFFELPAQVLSERAEISLLTASSGRDLYATFGHSAIRVFDPMLGIDKVYNYGTFDFNPPGFYLEFARGKLNYKLGTESFQHFDRVYEYLERSYTSQTYNLSQAQKQAMYEFLERNNLPENRYYLYDFFFDNCSSRLRDLYEKVLGDSLILADPHRQTDSTFRDMTDIYLEGRPWADFWIDLGLGSVVDVKTTAWDQMFLPDFLEIEMAKATVIRNGETVPFVSDQRLVRDMPSVIVPTPWYMTPLFLLGLVLMLVTYLTWPNLQNSRERYPWDGILYSLSGLGGIVVALLWFATDHTATAWNWNLLWLTPTHLIAAFYLFRKQQPDWMRHYFFVCAALGVILLLGCYMFPFIQSFSVNYIPWFLLVLLRNLVLYYKMNGHSWMPVWK